MAMRVVKQAHTHGAFRCYRINMFSLYRVYIFDPVKGKCDLYDNILMFEAHFVITALRLQNNMYLCAGFCGEIRMKELRGST